MWVGRKKVNEPRWYLEVIAGEKVDTFDIVWVVKLAQLFRTKISLGRNLNLRILNPEQ